MPRKRRRLVVRDRKKTALRIAIVVISLIALAGVAVLAALTAKNCGTQLITRTLPLTSSELVCGTGDGIMYVRGGALNFYSFKDEDNNFTRPLTAAPTGIAGSAGIKAVYSKNAVQIIDAPFDIEPEGEVIALRCGRAHAAVCTKRPNGDETVTVYGLNGQQIYEFPFSAGRLVNFGFSEASGSTLWLMELDTDSGSPRTTITTFDLDRMSSTGVITVSDQLVEDVFFTGSSVYIVGTDSLIRYSAAANREVYRVQLYGYRVIDKSLTGDSPVLLLMPRSASDIAGAPSLRILTVSQKDVAGETAVSVSVPEGAVGCHLVNGSLVIVTGNGLKLISNKGKPLESAPLPVGVTDSSEKLDEHHILMERSGEYVLLSVGK